MAVHKRAYRPTYEEASKHFREALEVVGDLEAGLGIEGDDINWYMARRPKPVA